MTTPSLLTATSPRGALRPLPLSPLISRTRLSLWQFHTAAGCSLWCSADLTLSNVAKRLGPLEYDAPSPLWCSLWCSFECTRECSLGEPLAKDAPLPLCPEPAVQAASEVSVTEPSRAAGSASGRAFKGANREDHVGGFPSLPAAACGGRGRRRQRDICALRPRRCPTPCPPAPKLSKRGRRGGGLRERERGLSASMD